MLFIITYTTQKEEIRLRKSDENHIVGKKEGQRDGILVAWGAKVARRRLTAQEKGRDDCKRGGDKGERERG